MPRQQSYRRGFSQRLRVFAFVVGHDEAVGWVLPLGDAGKLKSLNMRPFLADIL